MSQNKGLSNGFEVVSIDHALGTCTLRVNIDATTEKKFPYICEKGDFKEQFGEDKVLYLRLFNNKQLYNEKLSQMKMLKKFDWHPKFMECNLQDSKDFLEVVKQEMRKKEIPKPFYNPLALSSIAWKAFELDAIKPEIIIQASGGEHMDVFLKSFVERKNGKKESSPYLSICEKFLLTLVDLKSVGVVHGHLDESHIVISKKKKVGLIGMSGVDTVKKLIESSKLKKNIPPEVLYFSSSSNDAYEQILIKTYTESVHNLLMYYLDRVDNYDDENIKKHGLWKIFKEIIGEEVANTFENTNTDKGKVVLEIFKKDVIPKQIKELKLAERMKNQTITSHDGSIDVDVSLANESFIVYHAGWVLLQLVIADGVNNIVIPEVQDELIDLGLKMVSMDLFQRPTLSSALDRIRLVKKINENLFNMFENLGYFDEENGNEYVQEYSSLDDMRNTLDEVLPTDLQQALDEAVVKINRLESQLETYTAENQTYIEKIADFEDQLTEANSKLEDIEKRCGYYNKNKQYFIEFESVDDLRDAYDRAIETVRDVNKRLKEASVGAVDIKEEGTFDGDALETLRSHIDVITQGTRSPPVHELHLQIDGKKFSELQSENETLNKQLQDCKKDSAGAISSRTITETVNRGIESLMSTIQTHNSKFIK